MSKSPEAIGRWLGEHQYRFDGPEQFGGDEPNSLLAEYGGDRAELWAQRSAVRWLLAASWDYSQASGNIALPAVCGLRRHPGGRPPVPGGPLVPACYPAGLGHACQGQDSRVRHRDQARAGRL
jgi:hypothetical protein